MTRHNKFINSLSLDLQSQSEKNIENNLVIQFYDEIAEDEEFYASRKWAGLTDDKRVIKAFNSFYNLTPEDKEYLN
jgi:hypothetical protein